MRSRFSAFALAALLISAPASAAFHFIHVKEVFAGSPAHPNAQYVLLQAYDGGQSAVAGHSVLTFDAAGVSTGTFTFPPGPPLGNGAPQMTILVATPDAATIFNLTADLAMTPVLSPAGGKVCWEGSTPDDCFAWGNYTGSASGVGTPYNGDVGLIPGYAAQRRLDICLTPGNLDECDDTNDSEADFITVFPNPIQNNGTAGTPPPATCGNGNLEGLEGCDDGDTQGGDGCSAICHPEPAPMQPAGMLVDVTATGASDANGVFEPGESVRIEPSYRNTDSSNFGASAQITLTGPITASPPYPVYRISDGAAYYGVLLPLETKSCTADSDCYRVFADAQTRPGQHWDATADEILSNLGVTSWPLHIGDSFPDVPRAHNFYAFIENLFHNGITGGCAGGGYCPANPVTRAQMAVFLLKALGVGPTILRTAPDVFTDVPCEGRNRLLRLRIEELANLGITGGCGDATALLPEQHGHARPDGGLPAEGAGGLRPTTRRTASASSTTCPARPEPGSPTSSRSCSPARSRAAVRCRHRFTARKTRTTAGRWPCSSSRPSSCFSTGSRSLRFDREVGSGRGDDPRRRGRPPRARRFRGLSPAAPDPARAGSARLAPSRRIRRRISASDPGRARHRRAPPNPRRARPRRRTRSRSPGSSENARSCRRPVSRRSLRARSSRAAGSSCGSRSFASRVRATRSWSSCSRPPPPARGEAISASGPSRSGSRRWTRFHRGAEGSVTPGR